jgi:hypothetical protein
MDGGRGPPVGEVEMRDWYEDLADTMAKSPDLDKVQEALVKERVIREVMTKSGEPRDIVVEMIEAMKSMADEAVLDLMEGEPTTLRAALQRYVDALPDAYPNQEEATGWALEVTNDLASILGYPYPGPCKSPCEACSPA